MVKKQENTYNRLCLVAWLDAASVQFPSDEPGMMQYSVGWLVRDDKQWLVLAQSICDNEPHEVLEIPKAMVRKKFMVQGKKVGKTS